MSGEQLFGGMHNSQTNAKQHETAEQVRLACLVELVNNGPFMMAQVPAEDADGFDATGMEILIASGYASRITVRGRSGFVAATEKGTEAYQRYLGVDRSNEAERVRIANLSVK